MSEKQKIFIEVSGGPDSFALAWHKKLEANYRGDREAVGLHIVWGSHYGLQEFQAAKAVAETCGIELRVLRVDSIAANFWGTGEFNGRPILRNIFASVHSLAADYARMHGGCELANGSILEDATDMPQTRQLLRHIETMQSLTPVNSVKGPGSSLRVVAPLLDIDKATVFGQAVYEEGLNADSLSRVTYSCLTPTPDGQQCGECRSCRRRHQAFQDAELKDHTDYRSDPKQKGRI